MTCHLLLGFVLGVLACGLLWVTAVLDGYSNAARLIPERRERGASPEKVALRSLHEGRRE